jgi:hypothetical protein
MQSSSNRTSKRLARAVLGSQRKRVPRISSFAEPAPTTHDARVAEGIAEVGPELVLGSEEQDVIARVLEPLGVAHDAAVATRVVEARDLLDTVGSNLELLDPLPHAELGTLIESVVAVVNTSVLEGMPNAFLEAWARGIPVLTLQFDPDDVVKRESLASRRKARGSLRRRARELWDGRAIVPRSRGGCGPMGETHSMDAVGAGGSG